ncbi:YvrJ family protein [Solibacillus sp. FSL W7-1464]
MDQWIAILQEVTFPIFISFYLLYRIETKLEAIHTALVSLHHPADRT